ncbi:hypothetical protein ACWGAN_15305 [Streptomyces sp. NPDC054945]
MLVDDLGLPGIERGCRETSVALPATVAATISTSTHWCGTEQRTDPTEIVES